MKPGDYVVATNEAHSVKEFAEKAFDVVGLDWQKYVKGRSQVYATFGREVSAWRFFEGKQRVRLETHREF